MLSWVGLEPSETGLNDLMQLILAEIEASRQLEKIIFKSQNPAKEHFYFLHRPLVLKKMEKGGKSG
jgi:hypothetical protein